MTSSITNNVPYSYYNVLNPTKTSSNSSAPATPVSQDTDTGSSTTPTDTVKLSPLVSSLLDSLAPTNASDGNSLYSLLGDGSKSLEANIYANLLQTAYNNTPAQITGTQTSSSNSDPLQSLLSGYHAYLNQSNAPVTTPANPAAPTDITA